MQNKNCNYTIKRLCKQNITDVAILYKTIYNRSILQSQLLKKYCTSFTGIDFLGFIAYDNTNFPIGFFGVTPCFIKYSNQLILAAQATDAMTISEERMTGLFTELSNKTYHLCEISGIKILFGFPNQTSFKAMCNKHGWQQTNTMNRFSIPISALPLQKICSNFFIAKIWYQLYSNNILKKYWQPKSSFKNPVIDEDFAGISYNDDYLDYKCFTDSKILKIGEALVWVNLKQSLTIGNIVLGNSDFKEVIKQLKKIARKLGITEMLFQTSTGTNLDICFSGSYKPIPSFNIIVKDLGSNIPLNKIKFTFSDIDIF